VRFDLFKSLIFPLQGSAAGDILGFEIPHNEKCALLSYTLGSVTLGRSAMLAQHRLRPLQSSGFVSFDKTDL
jgi:hypothetical protein